MAQSSRIVLLLGSGPNLGAHISRKFISAGYQVAAVSRSGKHPEPDTISLTVKANLAEPKNVNRIFEEVRAKLGEPSVVVYNAFAFSISQADPRSADLETFQEHLAINTTSVFVAVQESIKSFDAIADIGAPCSFIYTGDNLNHKALQPFFTLGIGKAASSYLIEYTAGIYGGKGYGFYYVDERTIEGGAVGNDVNGEAHAELYYELANKAKPAVYLQTFVKGQGYVKF